ATVPELMSLLYQRRSSGPPTRSKFSSMPPFVEAQTAIKETPDDRHPPSVPPGPPKPPVHMLGGSAPMNSASGLSAGAMGASGSGAFSVTASAPVPAPSGFSAAPNDFEPLADSLQPDISLPSIPAMLSDLEPDVTHYPVEPVPAPVVESTSASFAEVSSPTEQPVSIPVVAPQPITQEPRGTSAVWVWVWVLLLGVVVFSAVAAFMVVDRFGDTLIERFLAEESVSAPARVNVAPPAAVAEPVEETVVEDATAPEGGESIASGEGDPEQAAGAPVADEELQENAVDATEEAPDPEPVDAAPEETKTAKAPVAKKKAVARSRRRAKPKRPAKPAPAASSTGIKKLGDDSNGLSASEQKLLAQFGSGKSAGVAKIDVKEQGSTSSQRDALDSKAVSSTVTSNKPRLQRCYERAIRGQQSPTAVRMNVSINVAASGRVSSVEVAGNGPGGLKECMEASIRRWKFPASSAGGPAKFPIVFSAN
ncbi:MAG: AgmX/PglI C-terminal domain-containing protein, partial [Myxococcota bacterium]